MDLQHQTSSVPEPVSKTGARAWARQVIKQFDRPSALISEASWGYLEGILDRDSQDKDAPNVMVYVPIGHEIDPIHAASWVTQRHGRLCVGRGVGTTAPLQPVAVDPDFVADGRWHLEDAEPDAWGMPVPRLHTPVSAASLHAVIVPGLAFDRAGNRLGRGKGVYDRFLSTLPPTTLRIGLVPSALVVDRLPTEPHDVPMHAVVTELGVIEPGR